nr:hypothetical protein [Tanacetum cinerariifolium]
EEGQSVSSYVLKMKGFIDNLERLGHTVTLGLGVSLILIGLRKEFDGFVQNYDMHSMGKKVNELHAILKLYEQALPKNNAPAFHAIRAGKVQKVNKHKKPQSQTAARGQNQRKGKNKLAYAPKPKIPPPPKREDPAKDSIYHECDGFINRFVNNTIYVSRNNMVYFSAIPRDSIFEIDLSNSYANDSSMFAVSNKRTKLNLDFALLWHCPLGYVSKKRIEKLQHDGLLNSTDLRDFEKCVSCMSGKMARKPYTHQVERAKDLLRLIHTNVCGPFKIMIPKGNNRLFFLLPTENKVLMARNAEFLENSLIAQEASGSLEDLEIIQEEYMHPSIDTSLNHEEDDQEINKPQSDINPIRRSTRTRRPTDRMCLYINTEEHELGDLGELANYKPALLDPEYNKWLNVMNVEKQSMKDNKVWDLVELPPNGKTVGSKWFFKKKTDMDGAAHIYKARLVRYHMKNSKCGSIPMQDKLRLSKSQGASTPAELKHMQNVLYASTVGSIMYVVRCSRPDVAFAHNITSRFQQNLGDLYWTTVKNILKYLRNTKDVFLVYEGNIKRELEVSCYTDAGYLTDADDLKSQTGYMFVLNGGAVHWKSDKQSIFATSSVEAEYIAAFVASKEAVWVRKFISRLGVVSIIEEPISLYCNNTGAITIANESRIIKGAIHFHAKLHYLHEVIEYGDVKLEKVHTDDNLADPFTKALVFPKHSEHTRNIRMLPASSLM